MATKRKKPSAAPLYVLRLPNLLSSADLARLASHTKDIQFSTAFEDRRKSPSSPDATTLSQALRLYSKSKRRAQTWGTSTASAGGRPRAPSP